MNKIVKSIFNRKKTTRISPREREQIAFETNARNQFKRLKAKGLGISVFSL